MEPKTYYSRSGNLVVCISPGKLVDVGGTHQRIGEKAIEFHPIGTHSINPENSKESAPPYGQLITRDKDAIAWIEAHRKELMDAGEQTDILTPQEYNTAITPQKKQTDDWKRRALESDGQAVELARRNIELESRMAELLAEQGKIPKRGPGRPPKTV